MSSMCHYSGVELEKSEGDERKLKNESSLKLISEEIPCSCRFCQEKREGLSPSGSPMISPTISLSSSDRSISSCSDFSVDVNSFERCHLEGGKVCSSAPGYLGYGVNGQLQSSGSEAPANRVDRLYKEMESNLKERHNVNDIRDPVRDVEIVENISSPEAKDQSSIEAVESLNEGKSSHAGDGEMEAQVWEPPEAEDLEDDLGGSVAFNEEDDDDECTDGIKWGKPSSLSSFREEGSRSFRLKKEKSTDCDLR